MTQISLFWSEDVMGMSQGWEAVKLELVRAWWGIIETSSPSGLLYILLTVDGIQSHYSVHWRLWNPPTAVYCQSQAMQTWWETGIYSSPSGSAHKIGFEMSGGQSLIGNSETSSLSGPPCLWLTVDGNWQIPKPLSDWIVAMYLPTSIYFQSQATWAWWETSLSQFPIRTHPL